MAVAGGAVSVWLGARWAGTGPPDVAVAQLAASVPRLQPLCRALGEGGPRAVGGKAVITAALRRGRRGLGRSGGRSCGPASLGAGASLRRPVRQASMRPGRGVRAAMLQNVGNHLRRVGRERRVGWGRVGGGGEGPWRMEAGFRCKSGVRPLGCHFARALC